MLARELALVVGVPDQSVVWISGNACVQLPHIQSPRVSTTIVEDALGLITDCCGHAYRLTPTLYRNVFVK